MTPSYEILRQTTNGTPELAGIPAEALNVFRSCMGQFILNDAHGLWLSPDSQDGHCSPNQLAITLGQRLAALSDLYVTKRTQSPIEDMLGAALLWMQVDWASFPRVDYINGPSEHEQTYGMTEGLDFYVTPQASIGPYKVDFLVWFVLGRNVGGIAIECDGHQWHERNKIQAARDKKRDRELLKAGFPVMRFTGSEIFADAFGCAVQVQEALSDVLARVSKDAQANA